MADLLTWEIKNDNPFRPRPYNGEFTEVRLELQNNINKLLYDFEEKYKVIVCFEKFEVSNSEKKFTLQLIIDLDEARFPV